MLACAIILACVFACQRATSDTGGAKGDSAPARAHELARSLASSASARPRPAAGPPASAVVGLSDADPAVPLEVLSLTTGGAAQSDALPWVVGIHGLGDTPRGYARLFGRLSLRAHVHLPRGLHERPRGYDWFGVRVRGDEQALSAAIRVAVERLSHTIVALSRDRRNVGKPVVTGFSQGGILSFALATLYPEQLSASLPIAGWLPPPLWPKAKPAGQMPIIAFHGQADQVVPYAPTELAVQRLKELGVDISLTSFPGLGHSVNAALYQAWQAALEKRLGQAAPK